MFALGVSAMQYGQVVGTITQRGADKAIGHAGHAIARRIHARHPQSATELYAFTQGILT